ncbi:MAG: hypothetical protein JNJ58_13820 [Chitinophagaceae bacterium]|nr:hypothetical protein [Chitinophagaceae bacterium]
MKKITIAIAFAFIGFSAVAQKANIQSAINYLKENDVANAKKMIDDAVKHESTMNSAKAWLLKGVIYQAIATPKDIMPQLVFVLNENPYMLDLSAANALKSSAPNAMTESIEAYKKSMSLDTKYSKEELLPLLGAMVGIGFNNGITQMNESKFTDAYQTLGDVVSLQKLDGGKVWKGTPQFDTLFANALMYQGYSAYQMSKEDDALPIFEECLKNPMINNADLYIMTTDIYEKKGNEAKWTETMKAAKVKFPNDPRLLNNEINYYLNHGRAEESIAKLKEGIAADPKRADLQIILGQTYYKMANPTDKADKPLAKPANSKDLEKDALACYNKAGELDPKNYNVQFYIGLLYYNQAKEVTDEMNKADDKKYATMKPQRDALIDKALPYLEKARSLLEAEGVNDANKMDYKSILSGLEQSYNITNKAEKAAEIQKIKSGVK